MKHLITALLLTTVASTAFAGPKSLTNAGSGTSADGRAFQQINVSCTGTSEVQQIIQFEGTRNWCLTDESYCGQKMKAAKKVCK